MKLKHLAVLLALSTVAADCPFGDSTSPNNSSDAIVGSYTLAKVNGNNLPAPYNDGGTNVTVTAGSFTVNANGTFSYSETRSSGVDAVAGTWVKSGSSYTFDPAEQPGESTQSNGTGTLSGTTFTLTVTDGSGTTVRIYNKTS